MNYFSVDKVEIRVGNTEIFAYSDTGFSDSLLTVTLLANPTFLKSVTVSTYLLTVTFCLGPNGVTVSKFLCIDTS